MPSSHSTQFPDPAKTSPSKDSSAADAAGVSPLVSPDKGLPHVEDILNSLSDSFIAIDSSWRILFVNSSYVNLVSELYPSPGHLVGENLWEKFPDLIGTEAGNCYRAAMEGQKPQVLEVYYERLRVWLEVRVYPSPRTLSIYARDISERKRTEGQLRESERRQQDLMRALPVACYTIDAEGRLTFFNDAAVKLWGRTPQLGQEFWCGAAGLMTLDGAPIAAEQSPVALALKEKRPIRGMEVFVIRADGSRRWVVPHPDPLFDSQGNCVGVVNVVMDVTEERATHEKTLKTAERLSLAISAADLGDWTWDATTDLITLSPRSCEIYGISSTPDLTRSRMRDLLLTEDRDRVRAALVMAVESRTDYDIEYRVNRLDGSRRWVAVRGRLFYRQDGEISGMVGMVQDITHRKNQVEELRAISEKMESQTRMFDATLSNITDLAYAFDLEGRWIFANKPLLELWGRSMDEIVGKSSFELGYPTELAERLTAQVKEVVATGHTVRGETNFVDAAGKTDFHEYIFNPVRDADGSITAVVGSTRLITERKQAEIALRDAQALLDATLSAAEIGTWLWDIPKNQVKTDGNMARMFGLSPEDNGGPLDHYLSVIHPEDRERVTSEISRALAGAEFESDYRLKLRSGEIRWFTARGRVQRNAAGQPLLFPGVLIDITERKRQEEALTRLSVRLEEQTRVFDTALSHITDFTYIFDLKGRFVYANKPLLDLWGMDIDQAVGKTFSELPYELVLAQRLQRQIEQVVSTGQPVRDETSYTNPSGEEGYFEYIFNPVLDDNGTVSAVVGSTRIITERKRAEAVGDGQRRVLQLIVEDAPLSQILGALMRTVEIGAASRMFGSVLLLVDGSLQVGAAPNLPSSYNAAIEGMAIGPNAGSCGTAAWSKKPVYVADIAADPLWGNCRELALSHGLRACWSTPILSSQGDVIGTFAMYFPEPREPNESDLAITELAVRTAAIAIENKKASAALRQSDNHLRIALEAARLGSWEWDAATGEVQSSARCKANFGVSSELKQFTEQDYSKLIHPDDSERVEAATVAAAETTEIYEMEYRVIWPDQSVHWIVESGRGLRDENGLITKVVGVTYEITERKKAEEALRSNEAQLRLVTDNAPVLLIRVDRQHRYTFVNRAYAERNGFKPEEMIGRRITDVIGAQAYESFGLQMDKALAGERVEFELEVPYALVGQRWTHVIYVPERGVDGQVTGLLGVISDIGERKQAELELKRARDEALDSSRAKDDFLAALSHELRTPLNPVLLLASDAAGNPDLPANIRADFDLIRKNVDLEARLIDDLLDLTRITRGKLLLDKSRCDVHSVLQDAVANVHPDLAEKKLELVSNFNAGQSLVLGDSVRLQQVFWNILKNAVKFTPPKGKVFLETSQAPERQMLVVRITDTGIGMTAEEINRAFQAFAQGDHATGSSSVHRFGGLGLGLAISKMLVDLHAGQIQAFSEGRDLGCTFVVELPLYQPTSGKPEAPAHFPTESVRTNTTPPLSVRSRSTVSKDRPAFRRILLVEDHAPTRLTLQHLLKLRNFEVATASSAADAIHLAGIGQFDLVISDVGLPDRSGYELMADLRALDPRLVGIALSGYGMEDDRARSAAAGFYAHLVKPVTIGMLEDAIASLPPVST